jgi:hypothetical protein
MFAMPHMLANYIHKQGGIVRQLVNRRHVPRKLGPDAMTPIFVAPDAISRENGVEMPWQIRRDGSRKSIEERVLYDIIEVTRLMCHGER